MNVFLLFRDRNFDWKKNLPYNEQELLHDLDLDVILKVMSAGDSYIYSVAKAVILCGEMDTATIRYRQEVLNDCISMYPQVRDLYHIVVKTIETVKKDFWLTGNRPLIHLSTSTSIMRILFNALRDLRHIADFYSKQFKSEGFRSLLAMLRTEFSDEYIRNVENHLDELEFNNGVLATARLGMGNIGADYRLHKRREGRRDVKRILSGKRDQYVFTIDPRDYNSSQSLSALRDKVIGNATLMLSESVSHVLGFFNDFRGELGFYIGCLNLHDQLNRNGLQFCMPLPYELNSNMFSFTGLYDISLALRLGGRIVANDLDARNRKLIIISGANRGGKSTFLRSIGLAQLMMQCGMFVAAGSYECEVSDGIFTHFKKEEDAEMRMGKLDEELKRFSDIVDHLNHGSMLLLNESFASTDNSNGAEIASQALGGLMEYGIKILFVTHNNEAADRFYRKNPADAEFLRAERKQDGSRTYRIIRGEPLKTSFAEDLYNSIFG